MVIVIHNIFVRVCVLVTFIGLDEVNNFRDNSSDVMFFKFEFWIVISISSFIEIRDVNKVPVSLPVAASAFDFISKCCAFNEWVVLFTRGLGRVFFCQYV